MEPHGVLSDVDLPASTPSRTSSPGVGELNWETTWELNVPLNRNTLRAE